MQSEYIYPEFYNRLSLNDWSDAGEPDPALLVIQQKDHILATHFPKRVSDKIDNRIRAEFPIYLSSEAMRR
ncbi:MAG: trimethylamine--corrinoid protein Co-methyltransferase [Halioglobus sp.]|jgi:trimethylamine--corrinoid protein Co-methyltransferase